MTLIIIKLSKRVRMEHLLRLTRVNKSQQIIGRMPHVCLIFGRIVYTRNSHRRLRFVYAGKFSMIGRRAMRSKFSGGMTETAKPHEKLEIV